MSEKTIHDYRALDHKEMPFQDRAKKFEEAIAPLSTEWGVIPSAVLTATQEALVAVPMLKDLWESSEK